MNRLDGINWQDDEEEVRALIQAACARLYRRHRTLIDCRAHERTIAGRLAGYLELLFDGWDVDANYNREGHAGAPKHDEQGLIVPDIIIHRRGQRRGANVVAMEMKGYWNQERSRDRRWPPSTATNSCSGWN